MINLFLSNSETFENFSQHTNTFFVVEIQKSIAVIVNTLHIYNTLCRQKLINQREKIRGV